MDFEFDVDFDILTQAAVKLLLIEFINIII